MLWLLASSPVPIQEARRILSYFREQSPLPKESGSVGKGGEPRPQIGLVQSTSLLHHFPGSLTARKSKTRFRWAPRPLSGVTGKGDTEPGMGIGDEIDAMGEGA